LEGLCSFLQLSTCPEQLLVRFCGWLLALTPDLSYASAAVLAEQLFLKRVLSLTQPPSRHLMAALTSFCSKYSQPFCQVLVAPVLREPGEGVLGSSPPVDQELSSALQIHQVLEVPLSERLLPVVLAVLGRQVRARCLADPQLAPAAMASNPPHSCPSHRRRCPPSSLTSWC
uniref:FA complementation group E n=1 Tax=Anas zonorhyncha TaxID=75864 RepID=A0A8B9UVC8_9AVES